MQCPRCYYTNAAGTSVCEYCGAQLAGASPAQGGGAASSKRKTVLGPAPSAPAPAPVPTRTSRIDPKDPFRIAAEGIASPSKTPPPLPPPAEPASPPPPPPQQPPPRARHTVLTGPERAGHAPLAGVALVVEADGAARPVVLREGRVRIGRRSDLEIVVADETASSEHALLRLQGEEAWILDTSSNGTVVAGDLCLNDRAPVRDGTVLAIGTTRIVLKLLSSGTLAQLDAGDP